MPFDTLGLGLCAWDTICLFERYPGPNKKVEVIERASCGGGPIPTALAIFSRLGGKAAFVGVVGDDIEGDQIRDDLRKYGVNTSCIIKRNRKKSPCAYVWVDARTGERTVALDAGDAQPFRVDELPVTALETTPYLLIDGRNAEVCHRAAEICRRGGGKVILDAGSPRRNIERLLEVTDHAVVSDDFLRETFPSLSPEDALKKMQEIGSESVVVTQGENGGIWREAHTSGIYRAFPVAIRDATGAGDAFHGGYLFGLLKGWDVERRCQFASAVAALVCRGLGGRASAPTYQEVLEFMEDSVSNT